MKKSDLKTGMLVELRNGERALVMEDMLVGNGTEIAYWGPMENFNKDLTNGCNSENDIVTVYSASTNRWGASFGLEQRSVLWTRPTTKTVKLNEKYTAVIDVEKGTVEVGCQTFAKERIVELYKALHGID